LLDSIEYGVQDCCNVVILSREVETYQYVIMGTKFDVQYIMIKGEQFTVSILR
jgi:hypothetical protein